MGSHYYDGRSRSRSQRQRQPQKPKDQYGGLKTSLQVIGLLICLRVLLPKMFPSEHERGEYKEHGRRGPYSDRRTDYTYESYEEIPRSRGPETSERDRSERARIAYQEPDETASDWGGTTVYGSESGRERRRERRERRRRIEY